MKILWVGPFHSDVALCQKTSTNQASAKWSRGLLKGLSSLGHEIRVIDHCTEQRWPRGKVFWQNDDAKWFLDWFPCERVSYCNVIGVKGHWLDWAYIRAARRIFKTWTPDVVLCYNSLHSFNVAVMKEASKRGIRCVPIILDGDDPRGDNWAKLLRDNRFSSGIVFLSWWMTANYPNRDVPVFQMDGGADAFRGLPPSDAEATGTVGYYTLVHTGALDRWRGLDFMKGVVRCCRRQDVRFVFCGKCDKARMWAEFDNDPRVDVKGFLPSEEVERICQSADAFLNVRDPSIGDNILNYPSKVPNYLAYGRPVVSTWIDSFSPDYRDVLDVCDNTVEGFVATIDHVLIRKPKERLAKFDQIQQWFCNCKSWQVQARRLVDFLGSLSSR